MNVFMWSALTVAVAAFFASVFEWTLHRFLMHKVFLGFFRYPYERHHLLHHRIFKADHTYHLIHDEDKRTIPMAWWNGMVLASIGAALFVPFGFIFGYPATISVSAFLALLGYYGIYEYMHWCMHLPLSEKRLMERSWPIGWIFFRLNGHHLLHHRYMNRNFNVVCPLADLCFGTLLVRSKVCFAQATGPSVPNVQPRQKLRPRIA